MSNMNIGKYIMKYNIYTCSYHRNLKVNFLYNYFGKIVFYTYTNQGHNHRIPHESLQVNLNILKLSGKKQIIILKKTVRLYDLSSCT